MIKLKINIYHKISKYSGWCILLSLLELIGSLEELYSFRSTIWNTQPQVSFNFGIFV